MYQSESRGEKTGEERRGRGSDFQGPGVGTRLKKKLYLNYIFHHFLMNDSYKLSSDDIEGKNPISGVVLIAHSLFPQVACFLALLLL